MDLNQQNIRFFNFWAKFYGYGPLSWWLKNIQKHVVGNMRVPRASSVLDVGCGQGYFLHMLLQQGVRKLHGIDLSPAMIARARQTLGRHAVLKTASVHRIPFRDSTFDFVASTEAFHHFPSPKKSLRDMARVLKKGGALCIADINFYSGIIHWLFKKLEPGHVKIYSAQEFRKLFEQTGLRVVRQKRIGWFVILTIGRKV
ncbi:class I SAM-dependent methyltransferase [Candidatus Woesearchaeota archaeon]|nr:class I SAM-dependent methyltransferase [Candidatus Woesearchaeota archaeon]